VLSTEQREMLLNHHPVAIINQADDAYKYEECRGKECAGSAGGVNSVDGDKQFSAVLMYRQESWALPSAYDECVDFDINKHGNIPDGFYIVEPGAYGDSETLTTFNNGWFGHEMIKEILLDGRDKTDEDIFYDRLTFDKIKK